MTMHNHPASPSRAAGARPDADVVIIGAGSGGLSTAYALKRRSVSVRILDRAAEVATSWRRRHPQLCLNTHRSLSHLAGLPFPKSTGAFPARDAVIRYLEDYARFAGVPIEHGVEVERIDQAAQGWRLQTSAGAISATHVVVATGRECVPFIPDWPGLDSFTGDVRHSADFGDVSQYRDKRVLVVGAGNSGTDVLNHLVRAGTRSLRVAVRHGPAIAPCRMLGFPMQRTAPLLEMMPAPLADRALKDMERLAFGNLARLGLSQHPQGGATRLRKGGITPAVDDGFIAALKAGRVHVHPAVERFDRADVITADGRRVEADFVIAATGYRTGLEPILGHLNVLDGKGEPLANGATAIDHCKGLWFIGMRASLSGFFRAARKDGQAIARKIHADLAGREFAGRSRGFAQTD